MDGGWAMANEAVSGMTKMPPGPCRSSPAQPHAHPTKSLRTPNQVIYSSLHVCHLRIRHHVHACAQRTRHDRPIDPMVALPLPCAWGQTGRSAGCRMGCGGGRASSAPKTSDNDLK